VNQRVGLALFILYLIQVLLGTIIHRFKPRSAVRRRPVQNYFHVFLGIVIIGTAFFQVRTGYKDEFPEFTGQGPLPKAVDIIFYVWVVVSFDFLATKRTLSWFVAFGICADWMPLSLG
jgi:hypothetical protein